MEHLSPEDDLTPFLSLYRPFPMSKASSSSKVGDASTLPQNVSAVMNSQDPFLIPNFKRIITVIDKHQQY